METFRERPIFGAGAGRLAAAVAFMLGAAPLVAAPTQPVATVEQGPVRIELSLGAGLVQGEARELVYDSGKGQRQKLSELIWDIEDLWMAGASGDLRFGRRWNLRVEGWTSIKDGGGQMEDFDWLMDEPDSPWTDWSLSDVDLYDAQKLSVELGAEVFNTRAGAFRLLGGYRMDSWSWVDHGIRHIYSTDPPVLFRDDVGPDEPTTGVEYDQEFDIPYIGAGWIWTSERWRLGGALRYSAWVSAEDKDFHVYTGDRFTETFSGGDFLAVELGAAWRIARATWVSLAANGHSIPEIAGDTEVTDAAGVTENIPDSAGIENRALMLSLALSRVF